MASLADVPAAIREMLSTHEAFRKLGFRSEDIFANYSTGGIVFMEVVAQEKKFVVSCGILRMSEEEFDKAWVAIVEALCKGEYREEDLMKMYEASWIGNHSAELVIKMTLRGFRFKRGVANG